MKNREDAKMIIHRSVTPKNKDDEYPAFVIAQKMDSFKIKIVSVVKNSNSWHVFGQCTETNGNKFISTGA
jgi:hypothetical protein